MSRIDGTSEIEKVQTEKIEPEKCENVEDFEKALDKRMDQLKEETESSRHWNLLADGISQKKSPDEIQKLKADGAERLGEKAENFKEACFGEYEGMPDDVRGQMVEYAKAEWEVAVKEEHTYDMALERQMGDSDETSDRQDPVSNEEGGLSFKEMSYTVLTGLSLVQGFSEGIQRPPSEPIPMEELVFYLADAQDIKHDEEATEGEGLADAVRAEKNNPAEVGKPPFDDGFQPFTAELPNGDSVTVSWRMPEDDVNTSDKEN